MRRVGRWVLALWVLLRARSSHDVAEVGSTPADEPAGPDPSRRTATESPAGEWLTVAALCAASLSAIAFCVLFFALPDTQLLGLSLGLALAFLAAAAILLGNRVLPQETAVEERPDLVREETEVEVDHLVRDGGEGVSRRRLLVAGGSAAGTALGAALVLPVLSLGPETGGSAATTPWAAGRRLVDEEDRPMSADDVEEGTFYTAFPEGAPRDELGSPLVLVRIPPAQLELPPGRDRWAPEGILAFSKICTHAGCPIALYRHPLYEPTSSGPALVCPCHYSTFDVRRGAKPVFGPAVRDLPQLPLRIGADRLLVAGGGFSGIVGPSYLGVRQP